MKIFNIAIFCLLISSDLVAQKSVEDFIFIPHPRSEDQSNMSVEPAIETIDLSLYDKIILGGDLTYYTSGSQFSMEYCDSLFNLSSPNTLWALGNHDVGDRFRVEEFTGRPGFYALYQNKITFVVFDTEEESIGFVSSNIAGEQVNMLLEVADTIENSSYLILIQHRLLWMIGNHDFDSLINYVGESTKQLDTSNFNSVVYPILQQIKKKGVQVICLGGDKSRINIDYSPENSITFLASTMAPEFPADSNDVIILDHDLKTDSIQWHFVPLTQLKQKSTDTTSTTSGIDTRQENLQLRIVNTMEGVAVHFSSDLSTFGLLNVYSLSGQLIETKQVQANENVSLSLTSSGIYILQIRTKKTVLTKKILMH